MIETIAEFEGEEYPFDQLDNICNLKIATLIQCTSSSQYIQERKKYQLLKNINSACLINVTQIYQEGLIIHLIYESCHKSLQTYMVSMLEQTSPELQIKTKKQLLKSLSFLLKDICEVLCANRLITNMCFQNFGVVEHAPTFQKATMKYFMGSFFETTEFSEEELQKFYFTEKKKILRQAEEFIQLEKRADNMPNFILRGSKLIFTDQLSETKTRKRSSESPNKMHYENDPETTEGNKKKRGRGNLKPKRHKYSCNFQEENFHFDLDNEKLNRSVNQENQNYSIKQTKSIKVQVQHIKATPKNRKNSVKFKITKCEQISIDQSLDDDDQLQIRKTGLYQRKSQIPKPSGEEKTYQQKVQQAKIRAEALLNKYNRAKNKSGK